MTASRGTALSIVLLLMLIGCRGPAYSTPSPVDTTTPKSLASSSTVGNTLWVMSVYQAEAGVLGWLMPCIQSWDLSLSNKMLETRYLGDREWLVHVSFQKWRNRPLGGDFGTWKVKQPTDEVTPYDDVAETIAAEEKANCLGGLRARFITRTIEGGAGGLQEIIVPLGDAGNE